MFWVSGRLCPVGVTRILVLGASVSVKSQPRSKFSGDVENSAVTLLFVISNLSNHTASVPFSVLEPSLKIEHLPILCKH